MGDEAYLGCDIDCSCCPCLGDVARQSLHGIVDVINCGGSENKAIHLVPVPTYTNVKNFKPCGYTVRMQPTVAIPEDCLETALSDHIVGIVLDQTIAANRVLADVLRQLECEVGKALTATEESRLPTLLCHSGSGVRDSRLWDATLGKNGFVGVFEEVGATGDRRPVRMLLARVSGIPAALEVHKNLLDEQYSSMKVGEFIGCKDYCAMRSLCRRNALRVLVIAAEKYGLEVPHKKDVQRAPRDSEELTPDMESLKRGLGKSSEVAEATYHNEGSVLLGETVDGESVVDYYDGCACTASAIGGLVYVQNPRCRVLVFDYKRAGVKSASKLPRAWPMPSQTAEPVEKPEERLTELYPSWKDGAITFKPISLLAT